MEVCVSSLFYYLEKKMAIYRQHLSVSNNKQKNAGKQHIKINVMYAIIMLCLLLHSVYVCYAELFFMSSVIDINPS